MRGMYSTPSHGTSMKMKTGESRKGGCFYNLPLPSDDMIFNFHNRIKNSSGSSVPCMCIAVQCNYGTAISHIQVKNK